MLSVALVIVMAAALLYFSQLLLSGATYCFGVGMPIFGTILILGAVGIILWVANFAYMEYRTLNPVPEVEVDEE